MSIIEKIKSFFNKKDELTSSELFKEVPEKVKPVISCAKCVMKKKCTRQKQPNDFCSWVIDIDFDKTKDSILILDDNEGLVSFLEDDIEEIFENKEANLSDYNLLKFVGAHAAFNFGAVQEKLNGLNIKFAIIDITIGGSAEGVDGVIKYTGVDVYEMLHKYNPEAKFIFYTGNALNPYIKSNKRLIDQFQEITGSNIDDHVLHKTSMDMDTRRQYLEKVIFSEVK